MPAPYPVGARRHYSDLGYVLLGQLAAAVTGTPLDRLAADLVHPPLGMADAHFRPGGQGLDRPMVATTHGRLD